MGSLAKGTSSTKKTLLRPPLDKQDTCQWLYKDMSPSGHVMSRNIVSSSQCTQLNEVALNHSSDPTRRFVAKTKSVASCRTDQGQQAAAQHCIMLKHMDSVKGNGGAGTDKRDMRSTSHGRREVDVGRMGKEELEELKWLLTEAKEVAMTLAYTDGTSQLRNADVCN